MVKITRNGKLKQDLLRDYQLIEILDGATNITYFGTVTNNGKWLIKEFDESSGLLKSYANFSNNPSYSTYSTAWANRATLTYDNFEDITGV